MSPHQDDPDERRCSRCEGLFLPGNMDGPLCWDCSDAVGLRCHLCGSAEVEADSPIGSPTCAECRPIRDHVVSMQTGPSGASLAVCACGWCSLVAGAKRHMVQDAKVRMHWRDVIRRARAAVMGEAA